MKKIFLLASTVVVIATLGCSGKPQHTMSQASALPVVQASPAPANPSPTVEPVAPLPALSSRSNQQAWHAANFRDVIGSFVALRRTSLDGQFDLVIVLKGTHAFVSFAKHGQWESVHHRAAQGKLMDLRLKFEDGKERYIVWDELAFGTPYAYSVVWSYPIKTGSSAGPVPDSKSDSIGGDELLIQEMMKHRAMLLEVAPGMTTQFDIAGLNREIAKAHAPKTESILVATRPEAE